MARPVSQTLEGSFSDWTGRLIDRIPYQHPKTNGNGRRRASEKRLAKMKKRCVLIPADYNNMMSSISWSRTAKNWRVDYTNLDTK